MDEDDRCLRKEEAVGVDVEISLAGERGEARGTTCTALDPELPPDDVGRSEIGFCGEERADRCRSDRFDYFEALDVRPAGIARIAALVTNPML
jgi:hypothetical protein